jgi:adenylate kinase family enzyme
LLQKNAVIVVGLQGAGKSTVVACLIERQYLSLSMSEALLWRTRNSETFAQNYPRAEFYDIGKPYPDTAVQEAFFARVSSIEGKNLVLDACTRTVDQVDMVVAYLKNEGYHVILVHLICDPDECKNRIARRVAYCEARGIEVRADDKDPVAVQNRFNHHFSTIEGILRRFAYHDVEIHEIDTEVPTDVVQAVVLQKVGSRALSTV